MDNQPNANASKDKYKNKRDQKPKAPRKITATYLRNSGLFYLQRFTASSGHFRTVMLRKIKRSCNFHKEQDYEECAALLDTLVQDFITEKHLDDDAYLRGMINSLRYSGKSKRIITAKLQQKQLPQGDIEEALREYDEENFEDPQEAEFLCALKFARKKRLGPFDKKEKYTFEKALNMMARNGFQYDTSKKIMALTDEDITQDYPDYQVFYP